MHDLPLMVPPLRASWEEGHYVFWWYIFMKYEQYYIKIYMVWWKSNNAKIILIFKIMCWNLNKQYTASSVSLTGSEFVSLNKFMSSCFVDKKKKNSVGWVLPHSRLTRLEPKKLIEPRFTPFMWPLNNFKYWPFVYDYMAQISSHHSHNKTIPLMWYAPIYIGRGLSEKSG